MHPFSGCIRGNTCTPVNIAACHEHPSLRRSCDTQTPLHCMQCLKGCNGCACLELLKVPRDVALQAVSLLGKQLRLPQKTLQLPLPLVRLEQVIDHLRHPKQDEKDTTKAIKSMLQIAAALLQMTEHPSTSARSQHICHLTL